jgi:hypothetical protein
MRALKQISKKEHTMTVILNIGLNRADRPTEKNTSRDVLKDLLALTFGFISANVHESDTEDTLVVEARTFDLVSLWTLIEKWGQDCIAVSIGEDHGFLYGPQADKWGPFNPEYFLLPNGERLA